VTGQRVVPPAGEVLDVLGDAVPAGTRAADRGHDRGDLGRVVRGVQTLAAVQRVAAGAADQHVLAQAAGERVGAATAVQGVVRVAAGERVGVGAADERLDVEADLVAAGRPPIVE
jgi:hypothetical protein